MRIIVIEDNHQTASMISLGLKQAGHIVLTAYDGENGLVMVMHEQCDILVLDLMLPDIDGLEVLSRIRKSNGRAKNIPVIILSVLGTPTDRINGLNIGADDYIVKPFLMDELIARLNAIQRRRNGNSWETVITIGALTLNMLDRRVFNGGKCLSLTSLEYKLLECLMRNRGRILTKSMLLDKVWGYDFEPQTNVVEARMCRLREKLGVCAKLIRNIKGLGYVVD